MHMRVLNPPAAFKSALLLLLPPLSPLLCGQKERHTNLFLKD